MSRPFLVLFLFLLLSALGFIYAQYSQIGYFRDPLDIPVSLAGSFGELRTGHFHTGLDLKTGGEEGLAVHAAADGFVRRIGISGLGYGNVLYIDHPNGYTTVYGHLQRFIDPIQNKAREIQYQTESFEQDIIFDSTQFPVKKGDIIGYSGNTGGSAGPHVHFEIRESATEKPVNPMLWGFAPKDTIAPTIRAIKIYPIDSNSQLKVSYKAGIRGIGKSLIALKGQNVKIAVSKIGGNYCMNNIAQLEAWGRIGVSIEAVDYQNGSFNHTGVYNIELCTDGEACFRKKMNSLDFDMKRFINTHVDYAERVKSGAWFEKSFVSESNVLPIYDLLKDKGIITLHAGKAKQLTYYLTDISGNQSQLSINISSRAQPFLQIAKDTLVMRDTIIQFKQNTHISEPGLKIDIPANTFYENWTFNWEAIPRKSPRAYSALYEIGNPAIPVHDYYNISLKANNLPERLQNKACILSYIMGYQGGQYKDGWISTRTRTLGKFFISADTVAPLIKPLNIRDNMNMANTKSIRFVIQDNMSGIKSYYAKIDGHFALVQQDNKYRLFYYEFDDRCPPGKHVFELVVSDYRNNEARCSYTFYR